MRPSMLCAVLLASLALPVGAEEDKKKEEEKFGNALADPSSAAH